jgi:hypothetical protein
MASLSQTSFEVRSRAEAEERVQSDLSVALVTLKLCWVLDRTSAIPDYGTFVATI